MRKDDHVPADVEAFLFDRDSQIRASRDELVGREGAWAGGVRAAEGYLRRVVANLNRVPELVVEHAEFGHYGSGYASFVDVFLTRRNGSARRVDLDGHTTVQGLSVALCRLAPIACVLSPDERSHHPDGHGYHSMPCLNAVTEMPIPGWEKGCEQIFQVLDRHRIALVGPRLLSRPALPHLRIDTNLDDGPPHSIFDVWFHWMD
ncbi:hypothetical protein [Microbispora bryophytorum]|uniref:Uncharacterized protein n=1 Tax=Microbispora bryophytorum TaxID=1460882 RepID=A0A8H9H360_9ACTN|nr:hypothetical protein [Microbispora bryophytorum]MBD3137097.1 hypothetical protein [Microbispora bryophytorum]TQS07342.1 hypothetical protein FLX07_11785 [Microbispora bryophytorum]GGO14455.1 hypothetical protein GCM10011574_34880 [Microbispora bryophytorum]